MDIKQVTNSELVKLAKSLEFMYEVELVNKENSYVQKGLTLAQLVIGKFEGTV